MKHSFVPPLLFFACAVGVYLFIFTILGSYRNIQYLSKEYGTSRCKAKTSVAFSKNHKTASSTVQNILLRFAWKRELNFVFPETGNILGVQFPFNKNLISNTPWAKANIKYDMFGLHAIWNHENIAEMMKPDTAYITILRNPIELFISSWDYFDMESYLKLSLSDFIKLDDKLKTLTIRKIPFKHIGENQMLRDLGLPIHDFNKEEAIRQKIKEVDDNFDLVMFAEHFDESLILMKELLCWSFDDITYLKLNSRNSGTKRNLFKNTSREEVASHLKNWLRGDFMLYNHFHDKFYKDYMPRIMGKKNLTTEVQYLKDRNAKLKKECVLKTVQDSHEIKDPKFQLWKDNLVGYEMASGCEYYGMKENDFIDVVRDDQTKRIFEQYNIDPALSEPKSQSQKIKDINEQIKEMRMQHFFKPMKPDSLTS